MTEKELNGEWRCEVQEMSTYEIYEKNHWITHEFWGGYVRHNELYRKIYSRENELVFDEFIAENHAVMMYQPFWKRQ